MAAALISTIEELRAQGEELYTLGQTDAAEASDVSASYGSNRRLEAYLPGIQASLLIDIGAAAKVRDRGDLDAGEQIEIDEMSRLFRPGKAPWIWARNSPPFFLSLLSAS